MLWLPDQRSGRSWGDRSAGFPALRCQGQQRQPIADPAQVTQERPGPCWLPHRNPHPPGSCAPPRLHRPLPRSMKGSRSRYARCDNGQHAHIARPGLPSPAARPDPQRSSDAPTRCHRSERDTPKTKPPIAAGLFPPPAPLARIQHHPPASRPGPAQTPAGLKRPAATGLLRFPAHGPGPGAHRAAHPWPQAPGPHRSPPVGLLQALVGWSPAVPPAGDSPPGCAPGHDATGHQAAPTCADGRQSHA